MPGRWLSLAILVSWISAVSWLLWHDVWPYWKPGQPPHYTIDLVDEVQRNQPSTYWEVYHNTQEGGADAPKYQGLTVVEYLHEADLFVQSCELQIRPGILAPRSLRNPRRGPHGPRTLRMLHPDELGPRNGQPQSSRPREPQDRITIRSLISSCAVNRSGQLRFFTMEMVGLLYQPAPANRAAEFEKELAALFPGQKQTDFYLYLTGAVAGEWLFPHVVFRLGSMQLDRDLPPVPVSHFATLLMPLEPIHRIVGLRPGQQWDVPLAHPLLIALAATRDDPAGAFPQVHAEVLPQREPLEWDRQKRPCLIIQYEGPDVRGQTWVEEASGRVLRHQFQLGRQEWSFERRAPISLKTP